MSSLDVVQDMDPTARAVAEVRAREAGMSLAQWLGALVNEHAAPATVRRHVFVAGGPAVRWGKTSVSVPAATDIMPSGAPLDVDLMAYVPMFSPPEIASDNPGRVVAGEEGYEDTWATWQVISAFPPRIDYAAILLSVAFAEADVAFQLPPHRSKARHKATSPWFHTLVDTCLHRSREVRNALVHNWAPSGRAERLCADAFLTLCDLTPVKHELLVLFQHDRGRASLELAKHLALATQQFELSAYLFAEVQAPAGDETSNEQQFKHLRATLLKKAGGGLSLTQGAERLGITRQALHKRIKAGTALGMMDGDELVLPTLQFADGSEKVRMIKGLEHVVRLFERSGGWAALQFLIEMDPNLAAAPIEALRVGKVKDVVAAARAYLSLDEE